ncbi:MAG: arsenate reductase ArsC [Chromatiaceae bacterium]|nr:arsenate reductase ArsC [Chromatiaceae bacterium]
MNSNVLFVCSGNSCRSQMAEGWLRALSAGRIATNSAGISPHGQNPRAIAVMAEAGVDISGQSSKELTQEHLDWADRVITVCGDAEETCPLLPPGTRKEHWPLPDPARATGSEEEILAVFRASRDDIHRRVADLLVRLNH